MSRILLGITGSVAALKAPVLVQALRDSGRAVKVVATEPSLAFFDPAILPHGGDAALSVHRQSTLYRDADEWPQAGWRRGDPVLHIELRNWAEVLMIAPLDANTLAKLAAGLCDNLLTCVYRAWDPARPVILAPAMNTLMWQHPATRRHLAQVAADFGCPTHGDLDELITGINADPAPLTVIPPVSKLLACGDEGMGAMADVAAIVHEVTRAVLRASLAPRGGEE